MRTHAHPALQEQLVNPLLLDGRKFGLRVHVLVAATSAPGLAAAVPPAPAGTGASSPRDAAARPGAGVAAARLAAFAFGESVLTKCGRPFDPADASALAQITCTSVSAAAAAIAMPLSGRSPLWLGR